MLTMMRPAPRAVTGHARDCRGTVNQSNSPQPASGAL